MTPPTHTCGIGGRDCRACAWEERLSRIPATQLSLWRTGCLSPIPEVRDSAPSWAPESAASNTAELERLVQRRGGPPSEVDCPWCGQAVAVVSDLGVITDHRRPDGQRCWGTYEALEVLRGR